VALLACGRTLTTWQQQHLPKLAKLANLTVLTLEPAFIAGLATRLARTITWSVTITEGVFYLTQGNDTSEARITLL
jgi:uncharacterized protein YaeQ